MVNHVIRIYSHQGEYNYTKVDVPVSFIKAGDTVEFKAIDSEALLFIPKFSTIFENSENQTKQNEYYAGKIELGESTTFTVRKDVTEVVEIPYAAYHYIKNDFVVGNSSPRLIIER